MTRLFGHGDLRLYLLKLLDEEPRHGYGVIVSLEDRLLGLYSPSPGTVYPRLQALAEEGLVEVVEESEGKKVYRLTDAGREELEARADELKDLGRRIASSAREMAKEIRDEVRSSVKDLRREVKEAAREARHEERRGKRGVVIKIEVGRSSDPVKALQRDLEGFVRDVLKAADRHDLGADRLAELREILRDVRVRIIEALEGA